MVIKSFSARELNQRSGAITRAVDQGFEVLITKRGRPAYRIVAADHDPASRSLVDAMAALPDTAHIDMDTERSDGPMRDVDL